VYQSAVLRYIQAYKTPNVGEGLGGNHADEMYVLGEIKTRSLTVHSVYVVLQHFVALHLSLIIQSRMQTCAKILKFGFFYFKIIFHVTSPLHVSPDMVIIKCRNMLRLSNVKNM
jgi:hypothetical protein